MSRSAFIYLVEESKQQEISLEHVVELMDYYKQITSKTGEQLGWEYNERAFPYEIEKKEEQGHSYLYLRGTDPKYHYLFIGVGTTKKQEKEQAYIQLTLPDGSSQGDVGKGNELAKFLAKKLEAQLHLFNERVMYFYKRK